MAKFETVLKERTFDEWLGRFETAIVNGSVSASLEDKSDFTSPDGRSRVSVRVFERYSVAGSNRVSLSLTLYQDETGEIHLSAITSGGSQAMFFKINTWGEEAFLDRLKELI